MIFSEAQMEMMLFTYTLLPWDAIQSCVAPAFMAASGWKLIARWA